VTATRIARCSRLLPALLVALVPVTLVLQLGTASPVEAHGRELAITVDSLVPDPEQPLRVLYRVDVVYAGDEDPLAGAAVELSGRRGDEEAFAPLALTEVQGAEGLYVGEVTFRRFGEHEMHLDVEATLGLGSGSVDFVDDIRPEPVDAALEAARQAEAERVASLQLLFSFEWWPDVITVLSRIVHSVAAVSYFVAAGLVLVLAWLGIPSRRPGLLHELRRGFLPVAVVSLVILFGAGLYQAAFDAPVAWPGIYDVDALLSIPYGDAYLVAFLFKVLAFVLLVVMAARIHRSLRTWDEHPTPETDATSIARLKRQTLVNALIGLGVAADVAIVIYLHYISHLGVFVV
jgi:hypothetical protein